MSEIGKRTIYVGPAMANACMAPLQVEGPALSAGTLPGTIVQRVATGIQDSAVAATVFGQRLLIANKDELRTRSVDDAWTQGDTMQAISPRSGEFFNALLAVGQNVTAPDTALTRSNGQLIIAATDGSEEIVAYADEILDNTAGAAPVLLRCYAA